MIEWHGLVLEQLIHHMFFAPKQTIRDFFLQLPYSPRFLLKTCRVGELSHLLKLINANHDVQVSLLSYFFGKIQNFLRFLCLWADAKRNGKLLRRIR